MTITADASDQLQGRELEMANPFFYKDKTIRIWEIYEEGHTEYYYEISDVHGELVKQSKNFNTHYLAKDDAIDYLEKESSRIY